MAIDPNFPSLRAWDGTEFQVVTGGAYDQEATGAALDAYLADHPTPPPPEAPPPPANAWSNKYSFMLLFRDDERARYRACIREARELPVELTTERHGLLDAFADFRELFDRLPEGVNRADAATAASLQLFTALGIIAPAEAAWRVPQVLAGQAPTDEPPAEPEPEEE